MMIVLAILGFPLIAWALLIQICNWHVLVSRIRKTNPNASFVPLVGLVIGLCGFLLVSMQWRSALYLLPIILLDPGGWAVMIEILFHILFFWRKSSESPEQREET